MYLDRVISIIDKEFVVEIRGNWFNHILELAKLIKKLSRRSRVHLLIYNSCKYIDIYRLYHEIMNYIEDIDNITVFWEDDVEALIYHTVLLESNVNNYLVIVLPYISEYVSQLENTYLHKLRRVLISEVVSKGWRVVVINPVGECSGVRSIYKTILANVVLNIKTDRSMVVKKLVLENTNKYTYSYK